MQTVAVALGAPSRTASIGFISFLSFYVVSVISVLTEIIYMSSRRWQATFFKSAVLGRLWKVTLGNPKAIPRPPQPSPSLADIRFPTPANCWRLLAGPAWRRVSHEHESGSNPARLPALPSGAFRVGLGADYGSLHSGGTSEPRQDGSDEHSFYGRRTDSRQTHLRRQERVRAAQVDRRAAGGQKPGVDRG